MCLRDICLNKSPQYQPLSSLRASRGNYSEMYIGTLIISQPKPFSSHKSHLTPDSRRRVKYKRRREVFRARSPVNMYVHNTWFEMRGDESYLLTLFSSEAPVLLSRSISSGLATYKAGSITFGMDLISVPNSFSIRCRA